VHAVAKGSRLGAPETRPDALLVTTPQIGNDKAGKSGILWSMMISCNIMMNTNEWYYRTLILLFLTYLVLIYLYIVLQISEAL
jgi:hypothetical protein